MAFISNSIQTHPYSHPHPHPFFPICIPITISLHCSNNSPRTLYYIRPISSIHRILITLTTQQIGMLVSSRPIIILFSKSIHEWEITIIMLLARAYDICMLSQTALPHSLQWDTRANTTIYYCFLFCLCHRSYLY